MNRSPIARRAEPLFATRKGKYLNAMNPASAERNEQNMVTVRGEGIEVTFKQIAGLLARRIVFNLSEGDGGARAARGADQVWLAGGCDSSRRSRVAREGGQRVKGGVKRAGRDAGV